MKVIRASVGYPALILSDGRSYFYDANNVRVCNGSQMGRSNARAEDITEDTTLYVQRLKWVDGDYDAEGAYWGGPEMCSLESIFCAYSEDGEVHIFHRASSMTEVVVWLAINYPDCKVTLDVDWIDVGDMSDLELGYIEAFMWSCSFSDDSNSDKTDDASLETHYRKSDIGQGVLKTVRNFCSEFDQAMCRFNACWMELWMACADTTAQYIGHDLFLTQVESGVSFKDKCNHNSNSVTQELSERLCDAAKQLPREMNFYVEDGVVKLDNY